MRNKSIKFHKNNNKKAININNSKKKLYNSQFVQIIHNNKKVYKKKFHLNISTMFVLNKQKINETKAHPLKRRTFSQKSKIVFQNFSLQSFDFQNGKVELSKNKPRPY
ncbi:hypothetical protein ACFFRR_003736 [Megaselia abdita]